jgi:hypothetical protein
VDGEEHGASSAQSSGEPARDFREDPGASGWTTTKQAAKALNVSRRSVQGYVGRGLLDAREEGEGVNRRFLISIDSLNALVDRRRRAAEQPANFAEASPEIEEVATDFANTGEGLRYLVERLEARTAEATELRIRLELTERAQSSLEEELAEANRRREEAEWMLRLPQGRRNPPRSPRRDRGSPIPQNLAPLLRRSGVGSGRGSLAGSTEGENRDEYPKPQ